MRRIPDASTESLMPFVEDTIDPGSVIHTGGWIGYLPLEGKGHRHRVAFLRDSYSGQRCGGTFSITCSGNPRATPT